MPTPEVAEPSRFLYEIGALSSTAERELGPVETAMVPAGPILPPPPPPAPQAQSPTMDGFALQALPAAPHATAIESRAPDEVLATPQVAFSGQDLAEKSMNDIAMHELEPEVDQAEFDTPGAQSRLLSGTLESCHCCIAGSRAQFFHDKFRQQSQTAKRWDPTLSILSIARTWSMQAFPCLLVGSGCLSFPLVRLLWARHGSL